VIRLENDELENDDEIEGDTIFLPPRSVILYDYNEGSNNVCYFCGKTLMTLFRR